MKFVDERLIIYNPDKSLENKPNCSARALSTAYNKKYSDIVDMAGGEDEVGDIFNIVSIFEKLGTQDIIELPSMPTVKQYCDTLGDGVYILLVVRPGNDKISHAICYIDGNWYDTYDDNDFLVRVSVLVRSGKSKVSTFSEDDIDEFIQYSKQVLFEKLLNKFKRASNVIVSDFYELNTNKRDQYQFIIGVIFDSENNKKITNLFKYSVSPWMKKEDVFADINNDCEEFINSIVLE